MTPRERTEIRIHFAVFLGGATLFLTGIYYAGERLLHTEKQNSPENSASEPAYRDPKSFFENITIEAKAAYVLDARTGKVLYAKNSEVALPLASIAKVMTALVSSRVQGGSVTISERALAMSREALAAPEEISPENFALSLGDAPNTFSSTSVPVTATSTSTSTLALAAGTTTIPIPPAKKPRLPELRAGERWNKRDLLSYTLIVSSNEGANALALAGGALFRNGAGEKDEDAFVREMNRAASELNFSSMRFYNPSGLDVDDAKNGGYASARDVAHFVAYVLREAPDVLEPTTAPRDSFRTLDGKFHAARNTNPLTVILPGVLASKTGFTDLAQGNLALAINVGPLRPVIVVVLGSSFHGRFTDAKILAETAIKAIAQ